MSARQRDVCGEPGPHTAHCTEEWDHQYSCYDASDDVSFNDRQDWLSPHNCGDAECPHNGYRAEGD